MSCTISQPTVILPRSVSSSRRSCISRNSTTVLATERARPNSTPAPVPQPSDQPLRQGSWDGDAADGEQVLERKMQPDAEHQEDDPDLGELIGDVLIGHEARRKRSEGDAGKQIANQRRKLQAMGEHTETEGKHEANRERRDERRHVQHRWALKELAPGVYHPDNEWRRRQPSSAARHRVTARQPA